MKAILIAAVLGGVLAAGGAQAHHSGSMYDIQKSVSLSGTVKEFEWTNPHSWLQLMATKPGGGEQEWSIELAAPGVLTHRGWKPSFFKPGDKVSVTVRPMKDGTAGGSFVTATLANGTVITTGNGSGGGTVAQPD